MPITMVVPRQSSGKKALNPRTVFGVTLRQLRQTRGYSQEPFAHYAGYHRNYIGQLERGEKSPSLRALFDLAKSFRMRPSEILEIVEQQLGLAR
jgi:transcriptional regulator with XRE-family HTH domain